MTTGRINQVSMLAMGAGLVSTESAIKSKLSGKETGIRISKRMKKKYLVMKKKRRKLFNQFR